MSNETNPRTTSDHGIKSQAEYVQSKITEMEDACDISPKSKERVRNRFNSEIARGNYPDPYDRIDLFRSMLSQAVKTEPLTGSAQHKAAKAVARERRRELLKRKPKRLERVYSRKNHKAADNPAKHRDPVAA